LQRFFLSLIILSIIIFSGCSVGDFIGAYFNTYYNAKKQFDEAESEVLNPPTATGRTERPFLAPFDVPPQTKTKFTTVIEKCSKLLQYHPDSKLVDDALQMIGKSYYYQNEHQSAERKFKELLSSYPESNLAFETKLLLANTYYRNNDKTTAASTARQLMDEAKSAKEDGIAARSALLLAHIEVENKNYKQATEYYQVAAELGETAEERSAAYRNVAKMYNQQAEYKKAVDAFVRAEETSNNYIGTYRGQIGQARMLSRLGQYEESLSLLDNLIKNTNYREFFGEIDLEIANVYRDEKEYASAEAQYRYVDTAYARSEFAADSYYQLGLMYETKLFKYDSARVAYDKGRAEFPQADITPTLVKRGDYLNKYFTYRNEIAKYDSIKEFILHPPDTTKGKAVVQDTVKGKGLAQDSTRHDSTGTKSFAKADSLIPKAPAIPPPPMDTVQVRLAYNTSELAGLFYSAIEVVDSAKYWYQRLLKDHPNSIYSPRALYTLAQIYRSDSSVATTQIDSLHKEIVRRFPESEFAAESRRHLGVPAPKKEVDPAEATYMNAESLVKKGDVASALKSLKGITEKDTTSPLAAKAQYTIGWIYENVKPNPDSSIANYQRLVKRFPNSQYASLVQPKLAEVELEKQKKLSADGGSKKDSTAQQAVPPKTEDELKKKVDEKIIPPPTKEAPKDSLMDELLINKDPKKKDDENPKP